MAKKRESHEAICHSWPGALKTERGRYTSISKRNSEGRPGVEVAGMGHTGKNIQVDAEAS